MAKVEGNSDAFMMRYGH